MTLIQIARFQREQRYQILPAYTQDGIILACVSQGSTNSTVFEDFIEQLLLLIGNVCPCVQRRPLSRDEFIVLQSQIFSWHTFFNHFSLRRPLSNVKKTAVDYAVDRFVDAVDRHSSYSPLLNCDCRGFLAFRST